MRLTTPSFYAAATFAIATLFTAPIVSPAQETTTTTTTPKSVTGVMTIDTAQVVYVSGDDAVVRLPDGSLRLLEVRPGTTLSVDGKASTPSSLTPGTTLAHIKVQRRLESDVTTVTQINGKITAKNGQFVTLRLDDGSSKIYRVPFDASFDVDGVEKKYADVTTGAKISATVVKSEGLSSQSSKAAVIGQTPPQSGTLLILK
jgi:hypothetical protein